MDGEPHLPSPVLYGVLAELVASALDAVWVVDEREIIEYLNPAAAALSGYAAEDLLGGPLSRILPRDVAHTHAGFLRAYVKGEGEGTTRVLGKFRELSIVSRNGRIVPVEIKAFEIASTDGKRRFGALMRDITDRKRAETRQRRLVEKLHRLASEDELTGLPNRRAFFDALDRTIAAARRHQRPACVAIADIDRFKRINDRYGHDAGDRALMSVAGILKSTMRSEDIVARIGGEEFAFLLPDTDIDAACGALDRLVDTISQTPIILPDGIALRITLSAGIAPLDVENNGTNSMRMADAALLRAKGSGRNRFCIADDASGRQSAAG